MLPESLVELVIEEAGENKELVSKASRTLHRHLETSYSHPFFSLQDRVVGSVVVREHPGEMSRPASVIGIIVLIGIFFLGR